MPRAKVNLIEIEYETLGNPESKPILLIVGLGSQLISWSDEFCKKLVDKDFFVIKFDNRDAGLSTKFDNAGVPDMTEIAGAYTRGEKPNLPYTLEDMANDAIGLLNALNIDKAHICGASLGGLIAQIIAYMYPSYVLSLTLIMSTTGNPSLPQGNPEVLAQFFAPIPSEREAYIEEIVKRDRLIYGNFDFDENRVRASRANEYDRCYYPKGVARQIAATAVPGNIQPKISAIKAPTLVIHGKEDPLHNIEAGKEIASTIPGAELLILDGMGHSLPHDILEKIVKAINVNSNKI